MIRVDQISAGDLADAIEWCENVGGVFHWEADSDYERSCGQARLHPLRSASLSPSEYDGHTIDWFNQVRELAAKRAQLLKGETRRQLLSGLEECLLCYQPFRSLSDGAAMIESKGYFDWDNTPPWDTWVGCLQGEDGPVLVCWVPEKYRSAVQAGLDVNPEACIYWALDAPISE